MKDAIHKGGNIARISSDDGDNDSSMLTRNDSFTDVDPTIQEPFTPRAVRYATGLADACNASRQTSPPSDIESDPPPSAQPPPSSFFAHSQDFEPDQGAPFENEFSRYMSSQGVAPHTAEYTRQRTKAIIDEIKFHYSSQQESYNPSLSQIERVKVQRLHIYQGMCRAVHLPVYTTEKECTRALRTVLVNIVDYIDNARTGQPIKVWRNFSAFRNYTLRDGKRIDPREAKADGGFLAVLLRKLVGRNTPAKSHRGQR
ncbi:hypothetical protein GGI43DRAFT_409116 [Trichoderma evansii]